MALAFGACASAAAPERVAQLGLSPPPARGVATPAQKDAGYPNLKLPRSTTGGLSLDFVQQDDVGATLYSGTRSFPKLGLAASELVGGVQYPLGRNWYTTLETSADARPTALGRGYAVLGQVHRALPGGWDMSLGLRYRVQDGGALFYGDTTLSDRSWTLYPHAAGTAGQAGYELRLNYRYGERNMLGFTFGSLNESDYGRQLLGMQPGDGRQFGLTGEHWLTPDWALNYGVMAHEQVGPHRGQGLRLGLRYRF